MSAAAKIIGCQPGVTTGAASATDSRRGTVNEYAGTANSQARGEVGMSEVTCPKCGEKIRVKGTGGRKPKDIPVIFVCDKLRTCRSVKQAAEELGCSRGYIYKVLKNQGKIPKDVIEAKAK